MDMEQTFGSNMPEMTLDEALNLAHSLSWRERADATIYLASEPLLPNSRRLLVLLKDGDLAVTEEGSVSLLRRSDELGMKLYLRALSTADPQFADVMLDNLDRLEKLEKVPLRTLLHRVVEDHSCDQEIIDGAEVLASYLREPLTHVKD